jgi:Family of unknown function (DUF6152)
MVRGVIVIEERNMLRKSVLAAVFGLLALVTPALAHHSHQVYEDEKTITAEGVITQVRWANPHVYITMDVPVDGDKGKTESWTFELAPVASVLASGVTPQVVKAGNPAKIIAHPAKDPTKHTGLFLGIEINGHVYARGTSTRE